MKMSEVLHRSRVLGGVIHLRGIRLISSHATQGGTQAGGSLAVATEVTTGAAVEGTMLEVFVRYRVTARSADDDSLEPVSAPTFAIESVWALNYELPETVQATLVDAEAFAAISGVMAAHPYVREHVARLTAQMGYESLVIDVARVPFEISPSEDYDMPLAAEGVT